MTYSNAVIEYCRYFKCQYKIAQVDCVRRLATSAKHFDKMLLKQIEWDRQKR